MTMLNIIYSLLSLVFITQANSELGLSPSNLCHNGISIGFIPDFDSEFTPNTPSDINQKLPQPMAIHVREMQKLQGNPVYQIAIMPPGGVDTINENLANSIGDKMKAVNDNGITVWLRFAPEFFSEPFNKPMVLAETSAGFCVNPETGIPPNGGATESSIKTTWLQSVLNKDFQKRVPSLKAILWYEVENQDQPR
uniref:Putative secreted protein n=1 Tax=Hemileia vastatrix TaxID=203904 RepID=T1UNX9_9BASI|nr:putative secreted protein [Hemileia vastatrix]